MKNWIAKACLVLSLFTFGVACSKPALYGSLQESPPIIKYYQVPPADAFRAAKEALVFLGYSVKQEDAAQGILETFWQPATADSHYVNVFGRKDYGTVGAYYRIVVKVKPRANNGSEVSITNAAKSYISHLQSSQEEESKIFTKIDDFTRKRDIQVTNIGLQ
jgi:hypothetical protein